MKNEINSTTKHYWLYVLRLKHDKYYIGITSKKNPHTRIAEHMNGFYSAQWVKKYEPIEPVEVIDIGNLTQAEADRLELQRTLQYMHKYGYQNVRGGKLNYSGKYFKFGDRYFREDEALVILTILFLLAILATILFLK
jgi:predicted GIY-YIG superfamily endonuclease